MESVSRQAVTTQDICSLAEAIRPNTDIIAITPSKILQGTVIRTINRESDLRDEYKKIIETEYESGTVELLYDPEGGPVCVKMDGEELISLTEVE